MIEDVALEFDICYICHYMLRTMVYLNEDQNREVTKLAMMEGVKRAELFRQFVDEGIQKRKRQMKKKDDWKKEWFAKAKEIRDKGLSGWKGVDVEAEIDDMRRDRI